jgi:hypothetical protein
VPHGDLIGRGSLASSLDESLVRAGVALDVARKSSLDTDDGVDHHRSWGSLLQVRRVGHRIVTLASVIIAAIAALAALGAVYFSWRVVAESARAQRQFDRAEMRRRLVEVGATYERIWWKYVREDYVDQDSDWYQERNLMAQLLVGLDDVLPHARDLLRVTSGEDAVDLKYRKDVQDALARLARAQSADGPRRWPWSSPGS